MQYKVEILEGNDKKLYTERETGITHTPFSLELSLFSAIRDGDKDKVKESIQKYYEYGFYIGNMSESEEDVITYWSVATISTAIHYAILGGLDETDAYNMSDDWIQKITKMKGFKDSLSFLEDKAYILTDAVRRAKEEKPVSLLITKCIHYIHIHLHERMTIEDLAAELGISRDYLSVLFKKENGIPLHQYILKEKMNASIDMMKSGMGYKDIAYTLSFSSQTHYIKAFKEIYGMTPGEYKRIYIK